MKRRSPGLRNAYSFAYRVAAINIYNVFQPSVLLQLGHRCFSSWGWVGGGCMGGHAGVQGALREVVNKQHKARPHLKVFPNPRLKSFLASTAR